MSFLRSIVLTLALSIFAGALGVWGGAYYFEAHRSHVLSLHHMVHDRLHLTANQQHRIEGVERAYIVKRQALEAEMRAANAELAQAYQESHAYTPKMHAAIDRFHRASDTLQAETMLHVIAMRGVLAPAQAAQFDDTVVRSLTAEGS